MQRVGVMVNSSYVRLDLGGQTLGPPILLPEMGNFDTVALGKKITSSDLSPPSGRARREPTSLAGNQEGSG